MKNAGKHADTLKTLVKKLSKDGKTRERPKLDPIRAIVYASLLSGASWKRVDEALKKFDEEFVDFNELRVATELEVIDLVGEEHPGIEDKAATLRNVLHGIFDRENSYKLDRLAELKKAELRDYVRGLPMINAFVEGFVTLTAFEHNAFPVDDEMLGYLVDEECVDPEATLEEAQAFLEQNIKGDELWDAFCFVHDDSVGHVRKTPRKKADEKGKKKG
jgi:hypothetical protein